MLYELRIYHCIPGRLPDLLKRFDTITTRIWQRHGIEQAGFWTVAIGDSNQTRQMLAALLSRSRATFASKLEEPTSRSRARLTAACRPSS